MTPLQEFGKHAASASYHYEELSINFPGARKRHLSAVDNAMRVYRAHPDLWGQMDAIGRDQLWGREFVRLSDEIKAEESV